jgi:phage-related protein
MYFVIGGNTVAELAIDGTFYIAGSINESQILPAAPTASVGYDSTRGVIYVPLNDSTRLFEIDSVGDVNISGSVLPSQIITWTGNNWEINNGASTAWFNIAGYRPGELNAVGDLKLAGHVTPYSSLDAPPTVVVASHAVAADFEFNEQTWIKKIDTNGKVKVRQRVGIHGGHDTGDGFLRERKVELLTVLRGTSPATYRAIKDALYTAVTREDLQLALDYERYLELKRIVKASEEFLPGMFGTGAKIKMQFVCENPFWVSSDLTTVDQTITSSPQTFYVNCGSQQEVYPIIRIEANEDIPNLDFENVTDGRSFDYDDTLFETGRTVTIDCKLGTVTLDGGHGNRIHNFSGQFIRLLKAANNELKVTGGNCDVQIEYRNYYL